MKHQYVELEIEAGGKPSEIIERLKKFQKEYGDVFIHLDAGANNISTYIEVEEEWILSVKGSGHIKSFVVLGVVEMKIEFGGKAEAMKFTDKETDRFRIYAKMFYPDMKIEQKRVGS